MDWRQTSNSITLFYQTLREYPGVSYQVKRISDSKLVFKLFFEKDVVTHELELVAGVEWPLVCKRNFDTMEVIIVDDCLFRTSCYIFKRNICVQQSVALPRSILPSQRRRRGSGSLRAATRYGGSRIPIVERTKSTR